MIKVREGTFETNSSSTHSMVIVEDSQLEKWKNGELFLMKYPNRFVLKEEVEQLDLEELSPWNRPLSFKEWWQEYLYSDLETNECEYITPKGEKIHIFCEYGYDG